MSRDSDDAHLIDVARAAKLIIQFTGETDVERFRASPLHQSAVLHQFLVLGEAAKRISENFKAKHPNVPWREMTGMRDRLIHGYDDVNLDVVWDTAAHDIPALLKQLEPFIPPQVEL
ncbi:MAG: DUF86 domain-containing protein [Rhodothermales bacterium]